MRYAFCGLFLIVPLVLAGCARAPCDRAQAQETGYRAALGGGAFSPPSGATPACRLAWQQGWERGQAEFCTPQRGWRDGTAGEPAAAICAAGVNQPVSYISAYRLAVEIDRLEAERQTLTATGEATDPLRATDLEQQLTDLRALAEQHGWREPEPLEDRLRAARKDSGR